MRISFSGPINIDDLAEMVDAIIECLKNTGVENLAATNLYVTPLKDGSQVRLVDDFGFEIKDIYVSKNDGIRIRIKSDTFLPLSHRKR